MNGLISARSYKYNHRIPPSADRHLPRLRQRDRRHGRSASERTEEGDV